jgi:hypothetical protein
MPSLAVSYYYQKGYFAGLSHNRVFFRQTLNKGERMALARNTITKEKYRVGWVQQH